MDFHMPAPMAMATTLILITPLAVLTSAILLAVSTYARTFRQAQMFLLPVTLVATLPALLAALPDIHLSPAVAVIPIANTALAIRDALVEEYRWGYLAIVFISTALYAGVSLRWVAGLLSREDLRLGLAAPEYSIRTAMARSRRGLAFGAIMVLLTYYGGSALQRPDGALGTWGGLAVTLWVLVLFPTVIYLLIFRLPKRETLGLSWPGARNLVGAVFMVPAAVLLIVPYMTLQDLVLPFPEGLLEEMEKVFGATELHPLVALFLMAVSPAICEELLWRGAVQGELEEEGRPMKTILWVGILFGLFHLSIYRLVPTACLGFLLAYLRLASGSILPCMLFHGLYNAVMFLMSRNGNDELLESAGRLEPALLGAFLMVVIARWLWAGKRPARRPGDPN